MLEHFGAPYDVNHFAKNMWNIRLGVQVICHPLSWRTNGKDLVTLVEMSLEFSTTFLLRNLFRVINVSVLDQTSTSALNQNKTLTFQK